MTVDAELFGDALPTYFTRFICRERECAELSGLLRSPGVVTVCGVGGAGKTRLAVQVARQLRADAGLRVCWVPLAATLDSAGVAPAVAHGLGLSGIGGGPAASWLRHSAPNGPCWCWTTANTWLPGVGRCWISSWPTVSICG